MKYIHVMALQLPLLYSGSYHCPSWQASANHGLEEPEEAAAAATGGSCSNCCNRVEGENWGFYFGNPQYWDTCSLSYFEYSLSYLEYNINTIQNIYITLCNIIIYSYYIYI